MRRFWIWLYRLAARHVEQQDAEGPEPIPFRRRRDPLLEHVDERLAILQSDLELLDRRDRQKRRQERRG